MNAEDTAWARNWLRHAQRDWGKDDTGGEDRLRSQLKRIQQMRPAAFDWLLANSDYARRLATQMQLKADANAEEAVRESWQDITAVGVRAKVRANVVPLRAAAQPMHSETKRGPVIEDEPL